uniref:Glutathione S-transferase n=1 Tax=Amblyomma triste TaxID=251400 RepID=A0A023GJ21_AMBTT
MAPVLGYWDVRGLAQPIRNLLIYKGVPFEDKRYKLGPAPDYARDEWLKDKLTLGLRFPNLPYYIDDNVRLTQSLTILRYLGRKYNLGAMNSKEATELDVLEQQARDLNLILAYGAVPQPRYQERLTSYAENVKDMLEPWSKLLASRKWALGDRLTYVDFLLYEGLDWHREFKPEAMERYPQLVDYMDRFEALPNLKEYFASDKYQKWPILGPLRPWGFKKERDNAHA